MMRLEGGYEILRCDLYVNVFGEGDSAGGGVLWLLLRVLERVGEWVGERKISDQGIDGGVRSALAECRSSFRSSLRGVGRGSLSIDSLMSLLVIFLR